MNFKCNICGATSLVRVDDQEVCAGCASPLEEATKKRGIESVADRAWTEAKVAAERVVDGFSGIRNAEISGIRYHGDRTNGEG